MKIMNTEFNIREPRHIAALIILMLSLLYIFGLPLYSSVATFLFSQEETVFNPTQGGITFSLILNTIVMVGCSLAWLKLVRNLNFTEALRDLGFRKKDNHIAVFYGVSTIILFWLAMVVVLSIIIAFTGFTEENTVVFQIGRALSWPGIVMVSLLAAVSEETFFRGFLQKRVGLIPASVLFGIVHVSYGTILQVVMPIILGLFLGFLYIKTQNIGSAVSAHFTFNLIQFVLLKLFIIAPLML